MAASTLYDVLDVDADVSAEELRAAYRRRARETHPDSGGSAEAFREVQDAWELLRDPVDRRRYDESLRDGAVADGDRVGEDLGSTSQPSAPRPRPTSAAAVVTGKRFGPKRLVKWALVSYAGYVVIGTLVTHFS